MQYIEKVRRCGKMRVKQAIQSTKSCISQCEDILQNEKPNDPYWQNELEFYKARLQALKVEI